MTWQGHKVLVSDRASFIGSHLVDALVELNGSVRIVDDLSSGKFENIQHHVNASRVEFIKADLKESDVARQAMKDTNIAFQLATDHGGRGYVELHQSEQNG